MLRVAGKVTPGREPFHRHRRRLRRHCRRRRRLVLGDVFPTTAFLVKDVSGLIDLAMTSKVEFVTSRMMRKKKKKINRVKKGAVESLNVF